MPTVAYPQVHRVGEENLAALQQAGQGGGLLLAALLDYYRRRGPGQYVAQTDVAREGLPPVRAGEAFPAQGVPGRQAPPPGFNFQPSRLPFLGPQGPDYSRLLPHLQAQQAQAELAQAPLKQRKLKADIALQERLPAIYEKAFTGGGDVLAPLLQRLKSQADEGDANAEQLLRYLLSQL